MASPGSAWTIGSALRWTAEYLTEHGDEHGRLSAEWLLAKACDLSRMDLYIRYDQPLTSSERANYRQMIQRRVQGDPLQYITGQAHFRFLTLTVNESVLIPRPETELLVSEFLAALEIRSETEASALHVADIGTGSGAVALSIASERPNLTVFATDISTAALDCARSNAQKMALSDRVLFYQGDMLDALADLGDSSLDGIVANPPYIPTDLLATLPREVRDFEPHRALDGGFDGLEPFRRLLTGAARLLKPEAVLAVELFETTLQDAVAIVADEGFVGVQVKKDLAGRDRVLLAFMPS